MPTVAVNQPFARRLPARCELVLLVRFEKLFALLQGFNDFVLSFGQLRSFYRVPAGDFVEFVAQSLQLIGA